MLKNDGRNHNRISGNVRKAILEEGTYGILRLRVSEMVISE
ncbi:hypothetical protein [Neobacillus muris]|nr:hypothetical protein [Neobacillus muris]